MSALHTDFYQLNIGLTYFNDKIHEKKAVFEVYYRQNPFSCPAIFTGLEKIIDTIKNFSFSKEDIDFLRSLQTFPDNYLNYLSTLHFSGNLYCVREGEVIFANEPFLIVEAPLIEAQILETVILNIVNYQVLISSKASNIKRLVKDDKLFEYGARRAHETEAALWGARAAYIGGFDATSLVSAGMRFGIPLVGTHSHSMIQVYDDEVAAFTAYANSHKDCVFLVDTYDVLSSGVPNAIKVAKQFGDKINFKGIRIDSGDLAYLSKEARKLLDAAGFNKAKIIASNDLDEETILSLKSEGSKIDYWGIGTKLITSNGHSSLGAVFKLVSVETDNGFKDVIKISNNIDKITTPGKKRINRIVNAKTSKVICDYISLWDEKIDEVIVFDYHLPEIKLKLENINMLPIMHNIFMGGKLIYKLPSLDEIRSYQHKVLSTFSAEHLRYKNPEHYLVYLSWNCYQNKLQLIKNKKEEVIRAATDN